MYTEVGEKGEEGSHRARLVYTEVGEKGEEGSHRARLVYTEVGEKSEEGSHRASCTQRLERRVRKEVTGRAVHRGWREG